jgi:hypothetical protein
MEQAAGKGPTSEPREAVIRANGFAWLRLKRRGRQKEWKTRENLQGRWLRFAAGAETAMTRRPAIGGQAAKEDAKRMSGSEKKWEVLGSRLPKRQGAGRGRSVPETSRCQSRCNPSFAPGARGIIWALRGLVNMLFGY